MYPILLLVILLLQAGAVPAQTGLEGNLGFLVGVPQKEFADQVNTGGGFGGEFLWAPAAGPLAVGVSLNYLIYGSETRTEPFSSSIPDVEVDVTTTNSIVLGHLFLRAQTRQGPVQPYVDALVGFDYLFTETSIKDDDWHDEDQGVFSTTNFDDSAFSWGFGGGCMIPVWQEATGKVQVLVDLQGHYLRGGEAEYLKKGSIRRENGKVSYDVSQSRTDLLLLKLGASVRF